MTSINGDWKKFSQEQKRRVYKAHALLKPEPSTSPDKLKLKLTEKFSAEARGAEHKKIEAQQRQKWAAE